MWSTSWKIYSLRVAKEEERMVKTKKKNPKQRCTNRERENFAKNQFVKELKSPPKIQLPLHLPNRSFIALLILGIFTSKFDVIDIQTGTWAQRRYRRRINQESLVRWQRWLWKKLNEKKKSECNRRSHRAVPASRARPYVLNSKYLVYQFIIITLRINYGWRWISVTPICIQRVRTMHQSSNTETIIFFWFSSSFFDKLHAKRNLLFLQSPPFWLSIQRRRRRRRKVNNKINEFRYFVDHGFHFWMSNHTNIYFL